MKLKIVDNVYRITQIKVILKTKNLLLFIQNVNNNRFQQIKYLKSLKLKMYNIKTFLLTQIYKNSITKVFSYSFIKSSILTLFYCIKNNKTLNKIMLSSISNHVYLLSIKLNNKLYTLKVIENGYSLNYNFNNQLIYKFLNSVLKKFIRNNVN